MRLWRQFNILLKLAGERDKLTITPRHRDIKTLLDTLGYLGLAAWHPGGGYKLIPRNVWKEFLNEWRSREPSHRFKCDGCQLRVKCPYRQVLKFLKEVVRE